MENDLAVDPVEAAALEERLKSTKLLAPTAVRNVKFLSSQQKEDRYTAETVTRSTESSRSWFQDNIS